MRYGFGFSLLIVAFGTGCGGGGKPATTGSSTSSAREASDPDPVAVLEELAEPVGPEERPSETDYTASYFIGGINRVSILKEGPTGCYMLMLSNTPVAGSSSLDVSVEPLQRDWMVLNSAVQRPCGGVGDLSAATRATGRIAIRECDIELDVVLEFDDEGSPRTESFQASGVPFGAKCTRAANR